MHADSGESASLDARLAAAQVEPSADPLAAWRRLREAEGPRTTIIDLYDLAARPRGEAGHQLSRAERTRLARSVMPVIWPGFELTEGSERDDVTLVVLPYDPAWPGRYQHWRGLLGAELAGAALRIEHVGSTAVPGLPAKPTIDIQVSVTDLEDEARYVTQIEQAGVQLRSRDALHRFFRPFAGQPRDVHLHVCQAGFRLERDHLLFRDYLRGHVAARDAYAQVKRDAARVWSDDRIAYTEAKTGIVLDVLAAAENWAAETSWTVTQPAP